MQKGNVDMDMRDRCSAGQKVRPSGIAQRQRTLTYEMAVVVVVALCEWSGL
jgi:hypothetical protein